MALGVGAALGLPLTGKGLAVHAGEAASAMEAATGSDRDRAAVYLEALFRLAGVPATRMAEVSECLRRMHGELHLWCSVHEHTHDALARLRAAGLRLGIVSNSDGRVDQALTAAGLRDYFDVVIDSSVFGTEKPDPAIFRAALEALDVAPEEALYVGDLYDVDVVGARAAGMEAVLLTPDGGRQNPACRTAASIDELVDALLVRKSP
jgi:HAD superfamily hydrolase (TIGR01549 family)